MGGSGPGPPTCRHRRRPCNALDPNHRLITRQSAIGNRQSAIGNRQSFTPASRWQPPAAIALFRSRYQPPVPPQPLPELEDDYRHVRIEVDGITVVYDEGSASRIILTVEGDLPPSTIDILRDDLLRKLEAIEQTPYTVLTRF